MIENIRLATDQHAPSWRFNSQIWLDTKITDVSTCRNFVKFRVVKGEKSLTWLVKIYIVIIIVFLVYSLQ
jgi:hypothetical protein